MERKQTGREHRLLSTPNISFKHFLPGLKSKDCLRVILEFAFGADDRLKLKMMAQSLCKKSIQLITHPSFKQLHMKWRAE